MWSVKDATGEMEEVNEGGTGEGGVHILCFSVLKKERKEK